jgi:hypothetical protein
MVSQEPPASRKRSWEDWQDDNFQELMSMPRMIFKVQSAPNDNSLPQFTANFVQKYEATVATWPRLPDHKTRKALLLVGWL